MQTIQPNSTVLVLNSSYEPLNFTSWKRAIILLFKEKAQYISKKVIRLVNFVRIPFRTQQLIHPTKANIIKRDNQECQYCGSRSHLTVDHVIPRSKGGKNTWENLVACCETCNVKKGNLDLSQLDMKLKNTPRKPISKVMLILNNTRDDEWREFLYC
jgi:5-methylcytosine-specific restriction endonuclease McrA